MKNKKPNLIKNKIINKNKCQATCNRKVIKRVPQAQIWRSPTLGNFHVVGKVLGVIVGHVQLVGVLGAGAKAHGSIVIDPSGTNRVIGTATGPTVIAALVEVVVVQMEGRGKGIPD